MVKYLLSALGAWCLVLATPVLAQSVGEKTGVNSVTGAAPSTADFVKMVAISDMYEIQTSKLAVQKGDEATKAFGTRMVADHTKTSSDLKDLVSKGKVKAEIPTQLDKAHESKLAKLQDKSAADFNNQYSIDQVEAHKDAVSLFERYSKNGDNAELKTWAGTTLPALQSHLKMAEDLNKK